MVENKPEKKDEATWRSGLAEVSDEPVNPRTYPVIFTPSFFTRQRVVIIGGGPVAERRVNTLLTAGASIRLIAPRVTPELAALSSSGEIEWLARPWLAGDVKDFPALLVFAATDNPVVNGEVEAEARQNGRLLNRADLPEACDFTLPGVVRSGEITLTVSTVAADSETSPGEGSGASPALTAYLRKKLAEIVGPEYSRLSALLRELRPRVKREVSPQSRPALWKRMVDSDALELLKQQRVDEAHQLLEDYIREESEKSR